VVDNLHITIIKEEEEGIVDGEKFSLRILHSFCVTGEYAESI
jgi:hypothetical protein